MFAKILKREYVELIRKSERLDIAREYLEKQDGCYVEAEPLLAMLGVERQTGVKDNE